MSAVLHGCASRNSLLTLLFFIFCFLDLMFSFFLGLFPQFVKEHPQELSEKGSLGIGIFRLWKSDWKILILSSHLIAVGPGRVLPSYKYFPLRVLKAFISSLSLVSWVTVEKSTFYCCPFVLPSHPLNVLRFSLHPQRSEVSRWPGSSPPPPFIVQCAFLGFWLCELMVFSLGKFSSDLFLWPFSLSFLKTTVELLVRYWIS